MRALQLLLMLNAVISMSCSKSVVIPADTYWETASPEEHQVDAGVLDVVKSEVGDLEDFMLC